MQIDDIGPEPLNNDLEDKVNKVVNKYMILMGKRAKGCGCRSCYSDARSLYIWYERIYSRDLQPEVDDPRYAHPYDYENIHKKDFPDLQPPLLPSGDEPVD